MISFKLEDKKYNMPTSWREVTVKQFFQFKSWQSGDKNFVRLLSILTGVDYDVMRKSKQLDVDDKLIPFMKWLEEPLTEKNAPRCSTITIDDKKYDVPKDIGNYSFEQKIELKNRMIECINKTGDTLECLKIATAIYLQPIVEQKDFSIKAAELFVDKLDDCKIVEVYAIGGFFLKKLLVSIIRNQPTSLLSQVKNKKMRALIHWMFSKKSTRLTLLPEVMF